MSIWHVHHITSHMIHEFKLFIKYFHSKAHKSYVQSKHSLDALHHVWHHWRIHNCFLLFKWCARTSLNIGEWDLRAEVFPLVCSTHIGIVWLQTTCKITHESCGQLLWFLYGGFCHFWSLTAVVTMNCLNVHQISPCVFHGISSSIRVWNNMKVSE